MKKTAVLLILLVLAFTGCQQKPNTQAVDVKAETLAINNLLDTLITAFKRQDVTTITSLLAEDVLVCGSDPSEFWDKQQVTEMWTQMLAQPVELNQTDEPIIKIAPDGHSAVAIQQYLMPAFSEKLRFRNDYHLIKVDGTWLIFTSNTGCIPKNEDLPKINEALNE